MGDSLWWPLVKPVNIREEKTSKYFRETYLKHLEWLLLVNPLFPLLRTKMEMHKAGGLLSGWERDWQRGKGEKKDFGGVCVPIVFRPGCLKRMVWLPASSYLSFKHQTQEWNPLNVQSENDKNFISPLKTFERALRPTDKYRLIFWWNPCGAWERKSSCVRFLYYSDRPIFGRSRGEDAKDG